jgi:AAA15 family ATPase/GTPase
MISQFSVKNFRSIKEEVTLDLQPAAISEHLSHIRTDIDGEMFLPISVIYGPNGGGKSNVLRAIYELIDRIMVSVCAVCPQNKNCKNNIKVTPIEPYKFSQVSITSPTEFEIFFRTQENEYRYNIDFFQDAVVSESLYKKALEGKKTTKLFSRDERSLLEIELKGAFKNIKVTELSKDIPLLSYLLITHRKNSIIREIYGWFESGIEVINFGDYRSEMRVNVKSSIKELFVDMIHELDIDIYDYRIIWDDDKEKIIDVITTHMIDDSAVELSLADESSGTRKLFSVLPRIANSLANGSVLIVDELDAKIHPQLLKYMIQLYTNTNTNKNKAQLIFTSHDLSTMNNELFRRDEIWFAAKNHEQATSLYSLVEFKDSNGDSVRKDAVYNKQYLEGRYGADPYLKKIIEWEVFQKNES